MSARAPAGSVNSAKGKAESVDISEMTRAESCNLPETEKTAVLWAAVQVPEIRAASQYFLKAEFSNASQIEALFKVSLIEQTVYLEGLSFLYHFRLPGPALSG